MLKIVEIAKAWIAAADPTPEQKEIAEYRIKVCEGCEYRGYEKLANSHYCKDCGCPLSRKIFSPLPGEEACPRSYWQK